MKNYKTVGNNWKKISKTEHGSEDSTLILSDSSKRSRQERGPSCVQYNMYANGIAAPSNKNIKS